MTEKTADSNSVALDYYLSGVKFDPRNYGCIYNAGCSYFYEQKYKNALKWFDLALKVNPSSIDSSLGKSLSLLKLGCFKEALTAIE